MPTLFLFNESPHHNEKSRHGLRLAAALTATGEAARLFLFADGVRLAETPADATFETAELLEKLRRNSAGISACRSCLAERNIHDEQLPDGFNIGTLDDAAR